MALPVYLYWIIPIYSPAINGAVEGPIPVPITNLGAVNVIEIPGYEQAYTVYRTSNKSLFDGTKTINLI